MVICKILFGKRYVFMTVQTEQSLCNIIKGISQIGHLFNVKMSQDYYVNAKLESHASTYRHKHVNIWA